MPNALDALPDALADVLGMVVADVHREWQKDVARLEAEKRAFIAEQRVEFDALKAELRAKAEAETARVAEALALVKDGSPGPAGADGLPGETGPRGEPGKDADQDAIAKLVREAVAALPPPVAGKDADPEEMRLAVKNEVAAAFSTITPPRDGKDGRDGIDADTDSIENFIVETVKSAIAEIELPEGKEGPQGPPGIQGKEGPKGADGVGLAGAVITRENALVVTLTDGTTRDLGVVVGKSGEPGKDGRDGVNGRDGVDGLGFDDMDLVEDERGVFMRFVRGDVTKEFRIPVPVDRGAFKAGQQYRKGDGVTWGGSFWLATEDTTDKPDGTGVTAWRCAVKRGRDGKDGKDGERGLEGKQGPAGKDLTALGPNGAKW